MKARSFLHGCKSLVYDNITLLISGLPDSALSPRQLICTRTV